MIALTHVSAEAYASLLQDSEHALGVLQERYGAGFFMRLQGILCAMAVRQCAEDLVEHRWPAEDAEELFEAVKEFEYDTIFEDNHLEAYKPQGPLLDMMLFSMCQAETEDWGEE